MMDRRIGAQLYNVRDFIQDAENLEKTLERIHNMGYKTAQISGIGKDIPAEKIAELLKKYDIEIICTHRDYNDLKNNLEAELAYHRTIGCSIIGIGSAPCERTEEGFRKFIEDVPSVIKALNDNGFPNLLYHNHSFEFEKCADGRTWYDLLIDETDLDFIVDVYWVINAGINPAALIRRMGARAKIIHFKDMCVKGNVPQMCPILEGNMDWDDIIAACDEAGSLWAAVEHDIISDGMCPFESLEISYNNLKTKGFC